MTTHYNFYALYESTGVTLIGGGDYESDKEAIRQAQDYVKPVDIVDKEVGSDRIKVLVWTANSGALNHWGRKE